jgi:hypothetical protein
VSAHHLEYITIHLPARKDELLAVRRPVKTDNRIGFEIGQLHSIKLSRLFVNVSCFSTGCPVNHARRINVEPPLQMCQ